MLDHPYSNMSFRKTGPTRSTVTSDTMARPSEMANRDSNASEGNATEKSCLRNCFDTLATFIENMPNLGYGSAFVVIVISFAVGATSGSFDIFVGAGCLASIIPCFAVALSYVVMPEYKRHPNSILFWRAIADLGFALHTLWSLVAYSDAYDERLDVCMDVGSNPDAQDCRYCIAFAAVTQFTLIAADGWFACLAYDLHSSLTNPFSSFKLSMKLYHIFVWSLATITTLVLLGTKSYGFGSVAICWIRRSSTVLAAAWGIYYIWIIIFGCLGVFVYIESRALLSRGLASTYKTRSEVIIANQRGVATAILYWFIVAAIYIIFIFPEGDDGDALRRYNFTQQVFGYVFACRGLVSAAMWFQNNSWSGFIAHLLRHGVLVNKASRYKLSAEERFRPQVNVALRKEMLFYITRGIQRAIDLNSRDPLPVDEYKRSFEFTVDDLSTGDNRQTAAPEDGAFKPSVYSSQEPSMAPSEFDDVVMPTPSRDNVSQEIRRNWFLSNVYAFGMRCRYRNEVTFTDYFPSLFATIRYAFNISEPNYVRSILNTLQAKMSEGASGAFMFPSADGCFLIKSTTEAELNVLLSILGAYTTYMLKNPKSLLTRFYGCHCVRMYGQNFYFIVVANIFHTNRNINSRYDIKGSWISRNADPVVRGKAVTCRHCGHRYVYGESSSAVVMDSDPEANKSMTNRLNTAKASETTDEICPERVGGHEPDVVLKDNDLTYKMRLHPQLAHDLVTIIKSDAEFLRDLGIMDYSLIIGVSNEEFEISTDNIAAPAAPVSPLENRTLRYTDSSSSFGGKPNDGRTDGNPTPNTATGSYDAGVTSGPRRVTRSSVDAPIAALRGRKSGLLKGNRGALGGTGSNVKSAEDLMFENMEDDGLEGGLDDKQDESMSAMPDATNSSLVASSDYPAAYLEEFTYPVTRVVGPAYYHIGIVDVLQTYDLRKRAETFAKRYILQKDGDGISSIPPAPYCKRFLQKVRDIMDVPKNAVFTSNGGSFRPSEYTERPSEFSSFSNPRLSKGGLAPAPVPAAPSPTAAASAGASAGAPQVEGKRWSTPKDAMFGVRAEQRGADSVMNEL